MPPLDEERRPSWSRQMEFIVTCVGMAVGLGNVWRFPHLAYENGGGAFLIPYFVCLLLLGIPLFCLEVLIGQFASKGPIKIWELNPLFKGLGYTMVMLAAVIGVYYNIVVAYSIYFLFASMQSTLPWTSCGNEWNTCFCRSSGMAAEMEDPMTWFNSTGLNCSGIQFDNSSVKSPSEEYFYNKVLELTPGIDQPGSLKWDITLCNMLAWFIIWLSLFRGVKSMGKAVYVSALVPYALMTILVIRGLTLEGAGKGIEYYLMPDPEQLRKASVWKAAASQIFFSLACCTGTVTAMSSYNKFHNNCFRDSILVPIINCCTSFYAGFAIFSVLGFMSEKYGKDVANVTTSGPGLVFVAYPEALGEMPVPQLWSIAFFLMMICIGMGSQFPGVETVLTGFQDEFPILRTKRNDFLFRAAVCVIGFLLGLPQTTQGGFYLFDLCDIFVGFPLLLVGLLEIVAIVWVYGHERFTEDIKLMLGNHKTARLFYFYYFSWTWYLVTPILIIAIIIFDCVEYVPITGEAYPEWAESLGWMIVAFIMMWVPLWYLIGFCYRGGYKLLRELSQPTLEWGPADPNHRTIPRYQLLFDLELRHRGHTNGTNDNGNSGCGTSLYGATRLANGNVNVCDGELQNQNGLQETQHNVNILDKKRLIIGDDENAFPV